MVDVAAAADGDVVGEELEGDDFEDGEEELGGGGMWMTCSTNWAIESSPSVAIAMKWAVTSWMLEGFFRI